MLRMKLRTCVHPSGKFIYGMHRPFFCAHNFRETHPIQHLGLTDEGFWVKNAANFPEGDVYESQAQVVYEIPNAFPFRGATFILKNWADEKAKHPEWISLHPKAEVSFSQTLREWGNANNIPAAKIHTLIKSLPCAVQHAIAAVTTDPEDLIVFARLSGEFVFDPAGDIPKGLKFRADECGNVKPVIHDHLLYEMVANNPALPDMYKEVMVLRPGVQGKSEIVGEWRADQSHIFEYLRRNSYIPGGHYAANMANDAVRYRVKDLTLTDMKGLRHLYYQRTYIRLAADLGINVPVRRRALTSDELEALRLAIISALKDSHLHGNLSFNRSLWGWNFGFDYAPSGYRLHASHQQIHQQFAMIPAEDAQEDGQNMPSEFFFIPYACGDLIAEFIDEYQKQTGKEFFEAYLQAIHANSRVDGRDGDQSLIIFEDSHVLLFVPKAQTSQWEIQLMTKQPIGNILEADMGARRSLDVGILTAVRILEQMGARMITCFEYSKPFDALASGQRLVYAFLPRLPESPGAFSEAQLRWINGHYPEDFAAACRRRLSVAVPEIFL